MPDTVFCTTNAKVSRLSVYTVCPSAVFETSYWIESNTFAPADFTAEIFSLYVSCLVQPPNLSDQLTFATRFLVPVSVFVFVPDVSANDIPTPPEVI